MQNEEDVFDTEKEAALQASLQAYEKPEARKHGVLGYAHLDPALSNDEHAVYVNPATKQVMIAYRGTDPAQLKDLQADVHIGLGTHAHSARFKRALATYDAVKAKYGNDTIKVTGHSLGGTLAKHVHQKKDVHAEVFNPGTSLGVAGVAIAPFLGPAAPFVAYRGAANIATNLKTRWECRKGNRNKPAYCHKLKTHRVRFDPISLNSGQYGKTTQKTVKHAHKAHMLGSFKRK